jgi:ABC-type Fe3+ transport system substrate-binding protein
VLYQRDKGEAVEIVYASEGNPMITGPVAIMKNAPNPSAARPFYSWLMGLEAQQLNADLAGLRSAHPRVRSARAASRSARSSSSRRTRGWWNRKATRSKPRTGPSLA